MFVSDYLMLNEEQREMMRSMGVFDAILDTDSKFSINIIRLRDSTVPEFIDAYNHIKRFFSEIATLLDAADRPSMEDKMYRSARKKFNFHEVNGINLGFSRSRHGAGWGDKLSDKFLLDAYQIVKKGSKQPEIFLLVSLFEEDVASDRLSDMIATIIEPEIITYTLKVMKALNITPETRPELVFLENGLILNRYKNVEVLLLPIEILHELPIAKSWDKIRLIAAKNKVIRQEMSNEISAEWSRWASADQKAYLRNHIFMNPEACSRVVDGYRNEALPLYNINEDPDYFAEVLLDRMRKDGGMQRQIEYPCSLVATREIIYLFKDWVENNRGWAVIHDAPSKKREKAVQRFMHLGAKYYVETNNLDISCEPDEGRGPVDIKISRGRDKTLAEIKLSTNRQYLHGYQTQINEYGNAERTNNLIYVFIDMGNPDRRRALEELCNRTHKAGQPCPELIVIDARQKKAASSYNSSSWNLDYDNATTLESKDFSEFNFSDVDFSIEWSDLKLSELPSFNFNDSE